MRVIILIKVGIKELRCELNEKSNISFNFIKKSQAFEEHGKERAKEMIFT